MKPSSEKLTDPQKQLIEFYKPLIEKTVERERERVIKMSQGCAEYCTAKVQEYLSTKVNSIENAGRHALQNHIGISYLLYDYKTKVLRMRYGTILYDVFGHSFTTSHDITHTYDKGENLLTDENKADYKIIFSQKLFDKAIVRYEQDYRAMMSTKLERSILKYVTDNFVEVKNITLDTGINGFEVRCILKDKAGFTYSMYTKAIDAGGHHIQCFHYRYITKIK